MKNGWSIKADPPHQEPILVRYPLRITDKKAAMNKAAKAGVELGEWFISPLHNQIEYIEMYGYQWGMCPEAEKAAQQVVNLPLHPRVSQSTAKKNIAFICQFEQVV